MYPELVKTSRKNAMRKIYFSKQKLLTYSKLSSGQRKCPDVSLRLIALFQIY